MDLGCVINYEKKELRIKICQENLGGDLPEIEHLEFRFKSSFHDFNTQG